MRRPKNEHRSLHFVLVVLGVTAIGTLTATAAAVASSGGNGPVDPVAVRDGNTTAVELSLAEAIARAQTTHETVAQAREAIQGVVADGFRGGIAHLTLQTVTLEVIGDTAWEEGLFTTADASGARLDHGKYIVIWQRVGDAWLMARDIMSSNLPPG